MKKVFLCILCIAGVLVGIGCVWNNRYRAKNYDCLTPVQEMGLFQKLDVESGSCSFEVPPSCRSVLQPFFRSMQSWYGELTLSDASAAVLQRDYDWELWTISETDWNHQTETVTNYPYSHFYMFEFDILKTRFIDKELYVSQLFDKEQDNTHRIGQLHSYFNPKNSTIMFYYTSS